MYQRNLTKQITSRRSKMSSEYKIYIDYCRMYYKMKGIRAENPMNTFYGLGMLLFCK